MAAIERDHASVRANRLVERRLPAFERDLGNQQPIAIPVDLALSHTNDATELAGLAGERLLDNLAENADTLALAREAPRRLFLRARDSLLSPRAREPAFQILPARVSLGDKIDVLDDKINVLARQPSAILGRVVTAVEAGEHAVPR